MSSRRHNRQQRIDDDSFPVRIIVKIDHRNWGAGADPWTMLTKMFGPTAAHHSHHKPTTPGATSVHFRSLADAQRFLDRFPEVTLVDGTESDVYRLHDMPMAFWLTSWKGEGEDTK